MTTAAPPSHRSATADPAPGAVPPPRAARLRRLLTATALGPALLFTALALAFLWPVTLGGKALLPTDALYVTPPWSAFAAEAGAGTPHNPLIADQILQNYSWKAFARAELWAGRLPLWNPHILTGMPFLAAGQYAVLYPPGALFWLLPLTAAYGWFTALHLVMAGLFMYLLLRVLGAGRTGAALSGAGFMLMGFLTVSYLWPMVLSSAVWLPLLLACAEQLIRSIEGRPAGETPGGRLGGLFWGLAGGAAVGLHLLAGHLEISVYVLSTVGFYSAARLLFAWRDRGLGTAITAGLALCGMVALGFSLAAVQLIPFFELIQANYRAGQVSYQEVAGWALPKKHLLAFLMPDVFGNPSQHSYFDLLTRQMEPVQGARDMAGEPRNYAFWGIKNYVEGTAYIGVAPLLLAAAGLLLRPSRTALIFAAGGAAALLLAFGTPLYAVLFYGIPGFGQIHSPFRWVFPWGVATLVLAGLGLDALLKRSGAAHGNTTSGSGKGAASLLAALALGAGLALLAALAVATAAPGPALALAGRFLAGNEMARAAFASPSMFFSYEARVLASFGALLAASGGVLLWLLRARGRGVRWAGAAFVALLALDLAQFGAGFNAATDPALVKFVPPSLRFLQEDRSLFRIVTVGDGGVLRPNSGMLAGLEDVRGYDTIIPKQYVEFWRAIEEPSGLLYSQIDRLSDPASLASPLVSLMNVKYALSAAPVSVPGWTEVYRGEVYIYRNEAVLPRAFAVFDEQRVEALPDALAAMIAPGFDPRRTAVIEHPAALSSFMGPTPPAAGTRPAPPATSGAPPGAAVEVVGYQPGKLSITASMPRDGLVVITDQHFPGWRARTADGAEAPVLRADGIFRGVRLPAGEHLLTLSYAPDSFRVGALFSLMGGVTLLLGGAAWAGRRYYREAGEGGTALRIVKNSASPMAAQLLGRVVDFGFAVFMLRTLGPAEAGNYGFAVVLIGYFGILTDYGMGILLTREVARDRLLTGRYLATVTALRLGLGLVSAPLLGLVLWGYATAFGLAPSAIWGALLFLVSLFPSAISATISSVFSAYERMEIPAALTILTTMLRATIGVVTLLLGWGVVGLGITSVAASTLTMLAFVALGLRALGLPKLIVDRAFSRQVMNASTPLMLNQLLNTLFFRVDVMMLQPLAGASAVGYYTTAYKFVDGLNVIPSYFTIALFPLMSRQAAEAKDALLRTHIRAMKALLIIALPVSMGMTIIAPQLIVGFFGDAYAPSVVALQVLIWYLPFSYLNSVTHYVLIAAGRQRFLTLAFFIGTSFNVITNLLLIPHWGILAAAFTTVASELVLLLPFWWGIHKHIGHVPLGPLLLRPTLAMLVMGAAVYPLRDANLLLVAATGAAVYTAALLALGGLDAEDRRLLRTLRSRRAGP